jgi:adenosylcobinamide kinase/adenosylcobinamide-phosphate guanylyltransferase
VLVDCLTFWLANAMAAQRDVAGETARLCAAIGALAGPAVFVSNEVGSGIVPGTRLGRDFRDAQGRLNQAVARACDGVALVVAGLPIQLKPAPRPRFDLQ